MSDEEIEKLKEDNTSLRLEIHKVDLTNTKLREETDRLNKENMLLLEANADLAKKLGERNQTVSNLSEALQKLGEK